jgi:hypothetical protein
MTCDCECPDCLRARDRYSDNDKVHACVAALMNRFDANPFAREEHADKTIDGIRAVIETGFGKRAAARVRIRVH